MRLGAAAAIFATVAACVARPAAAATPDEIDAAIGRARDWLFARPEYVANGNWEAGNAGNQEQDGGETALMTYALLASGVSPNDPRLKRPIEFLRRAEIEGIYAVGLRAQLWQYLPRTVDNGAFVLRDARLLVRNLEHDSSKPDAGLFDYIVAPRVRIDLSVSQYGTLGLWACAQLGSEVSNGTWRLIDNKWRALQQKDTGGWAYSGDAATTGSMTAAGVATLFITQDYLGAAAGAPDNGNATNPAIDRGVEYLAAELPRIIGDPGYPNRLYTLYGIERIGVAGGYKLLGGIDWYAAGSDFLVRTASPNGNWSGEWSPEISTAFAVLFLARGREPVMMNKVKYDQLAADGSATESRWNQRGRDVASVARFVGREMERSFNWQIVDLAAGSVRDLHDAPIAYLAYRRPTPPKLTPEAMDKLRAYVEGGGMLVLNADWPPRDRQVAPTTRGVPAAARVSTPATTRVADVAVPPLLTELFPYATVRPLPATHPILVGQQFKAARWARQPIVYEVTNGVRALALVLADDAGAAWQLGETTKSAEKFELMADIYQYAIDKEHAQVKGRTHFVDAEQPATQPKTTSVRVARVQFNGNWDPEPGGWRRIRGLARQDGVDVAVEPVAIERAGLGGYAIAHLTGVGPMRLSLAAVGRLKEFVAGGGLLLVDAAGGDVTFGKDVERTLSQTFDAFAPTATTLTADDPILALRGKPPIAFRYRTFAIASVGATTKPRLRGTKVDGRYRVLYSPEDLSVGLVGQPVDGIRGYTPATATEVVLRLVRGAAK